MSGPSGKHASPRKKITASHDEWARWEKLAAEVGLTLSEWMREGGRIHERVQLRPDGVLTGADWRKVVRG